MVGYTVPYTAPAGALLTDIGCSLSELQFANQGLMTVSLQTCAGQIVLSCSPFSLTSYEIQGTLFFKHLSV
jgi:hypothetical protein